MGLSRPSLGSHCLYHLNDPFLHELESLRLSPEPGAPLLACHIDLTNAFWSLTLPEPYKNSFRVRIDGKFFFPLFLPTFWLAFFASHMPICTGFCDGISGHQWCPGAALFRRFFGHSLWKSQGGIGVAAPVRCSAQGGGSH